MDRELVAVAQRARTRAAAAEVAVIRGTDGATVTAVGGQHAVIHVDIPRVGNVGFVITAPGEPTLFHPGDSYEATPEGIDVLAIPMSAPWAKLGEAIDFVRAVAPRTAFPIHDTGLSERGYPGSWRNLEQLGRVEQLVRLPADGELEA